MNSRSGVQPGRAGTALCCRSAAAATPAGGIDRVRIIQTRAATTWRAAAKPGCIARVLIIDAGAPGTGGTHTTTTPAGIIDRVCVIESGAAAIGPPTAITGTVHRICVGHTTLRTGRRCPDQRARADQCRAAYDPAKKRPAADSVTSAIFRIM